MEEVNLLNMESRSQLVNRMGTLAVALCGHLIVLHLLIQTPTYNSRWASSLRREWHLVVIPSASIVPRDTLATMQALGDLGANYFVFARAVFRELYLTGLVMLSPR